MLFIKLRPPKEATENGVKMVKVLHGAGARERREGGEGGGVQVATASELSWRINQMRPALIANQ